MQQQNLATEAGTKQSERFGCKIKWKLNLSAKLPAGNTISGAQIASRGNILLKKSQGTLCPAASVSVVQLSCCFALVHPSPGFY
jgi:hypothetical protein